MRATAIADGGSARPCRRLAGLRDGHVAYPGLRGSGGSGRDPLRWCREPATEAIRRNLRSLRAIRPHQRVPPHRRILHLELPPIAGVYGDSIWPEALVDGKWEWRGDLSHYA